jgi:single-stranded-DNA-specific exonuclease
MKEIKNLKRVSQRIKRAVREGEKIFLFGDSDLDGATSLIILEESIKTLGGTIIGVYFSTRDFKENYGLNKKFLSYLENFEPALLITTDCGVTNHQEISTLKQRGWEIIVMDHHQVLDRVPDDALVVDPKQPGDNYPFKEFAAVGLVYYLSRLLLKKGRFSAIDQSFLELAAVGTLADMMKKKDDNKEIIDKGLSSLKDTNRPGLKALIKNIAKPNEGPDKIVQKIISVLNITEVEKHIAQNYLLLTADNEVKGEKLARALIDKNKERRKIMEELVDLIKKNISGKENDIIIFEGYQNYPLVLTGAIASRISNIFLKPTFIFKKGKGVFKGSLRTPKGVNGVEAMQSCSHLLEIFGGHPQAAGFTVKEENLEKFRECLKDYFRKKIK